MTIELAVSRLAKHAGECEGVKAAPEFPPEDSAVFPFAVTYPESGVIRGEAVNTYRFIHTVIVEFHVNRTILPRAVETATALIEEFGKKLVGDPTLADTIQTIIMDAGQNVTYEFGGLEWAGTPTIGVRFHVPVKIRGAV